MSDNMALKSAKNILRKEIKQRLKALSDAEKTRQSSVVTKMLFASPEYQESKRISLFLSMSDEVKTYQIMKNILETGKHCFIPRYIGSHMDMVRLHSMEDYDQLPETSWKIKQPPDDEKREDALETGGLDLILMPGLGFSHQGDRLGRGKGYYDSYLSRCKSVTGRLPDTIALAYFEQLCETIPTSEHDVPIDKVLFEDKSLTS